MNILLYILTGIGALIMGCAIWANIEFQVEKKRHNQRSKMKNDVIYFTISLPNDCVIYRREIHGKPIFVTPMEYIVFLEKEKLRGE